MRINLSRKKIKDPFVGKVEELSGQNLLACYQCGKCSAGCPAVSQMDILPNHPIRSTRSQGGASGIQINLDLCFLFHMQCSVSKRHQYR